MKLCRDCKHSKPWGFWPFQDWRLAQCLSPKREVRVDRATGKARANYCSVERENLPEYQNCCGPEGRWWEAK